MSKTSKNPLEFLEEEPNLTISISGDHEGKGVISSIIANALYGAGIKNVKHLSFDENNFTIMREAVAEAKTENSLHNCNVVIIEWDELEVDEMAIKEHLEKNAMEYSDSTNEEEVPPENTETKSKEVSLENE